jgi:uroporphyrinogen-III synthase
MILYLGTEVPSHLSNKVVHYPVLQLVAQPIPLNIIKELPAFTHVIFTSKNAVTFFLEHIPSLEGKIVIAIGQMTAKRLRLHGYPPTHIAQEETQEGLIALLTTLDLKNSYLLLPCSARARPLLKKFLQAKGLRHQVVDLYTTQFQRPEPVPNLEEFDEIIFTSPSTVEAFLAIYSKLPENKKLTSLGPITQTVLNGGIYARLSTSTTSL